MELPIRDPNLAMEMAYAEKPYRDMAKIALSHSDVLVQDEGLRLVRLGIAASTSVYYDTIEKQREDERYASELQKNLNIASYIESKTPQKYIKDLRRYARENSTRLGGTSTEAAKQTIRVVRELVSRNENAFTSIERDPDVYPSTLEFRPYDLSEKLEWLEDKNNWQYLEEKSGKFLLSYTRHILGFRTVSKRVSERQNGQIPDFDELPEEYAQAAYDSLTEEWLAYYKLARHHGILATITGKNRPLLYNNVNVLRKALQQERDRYDSMNDYEIGTVFESSADFYNQCKWIMDQKEQRHQRLREKETRRNISKKTALPATLKGEILNYHLDDEEQQDFVSTTDPETVLPIHNTGDIEKVLKALAKKHAIEMGEQYGEYVGGRDLFAGFKLEFDEGIRPKGFNGRVEDVRMRHLPLTEEFVESFIKKRKLEYIEDFALIARIGVFSDLYSTGRGKIGEAMQEYVLQGRNLQNPHSRNIRISKLANLSGDKLVEYLNQQSDKIDYVVKHNNMAAPLSAGAPTLGKRR